MERRLYTWCYIELLEHFYNFDNLKLTGDALIAIDSPDDASWYYIKALKEKYNNSKIEMIQASQEILVGLSLKHTTTKKLFRIT
jgi:hypothetical protein